MLDVNQLSGFGVKPDFLPTDIAGIEWWLRSDMGVTLNGSTVSSWASQDGGTAKSVDEASGTKQPTFVTNVINGHPVLRFDGTDDELTQAVGHVIAAPYHTFVVLQANSGNANLDCFVSYDNDTADTNMARLLHIVATPSWRFDGTAIGPESTPYTVDANVIIDFYYNGASSYIRQNNGTQVNTVNNPGTTAADGLALGSRSGIDRFAAMDIAELITYNREITGVELLNLYTYLNNRYGFTSTKPLDVSFRGTGASNTASPRQYNITFTDEAVPKKIIVMAFDTATNITGMTLAGAAMTNVVPKVDNGPVGLSFWELNTNFTGVQTLSITYPSLPPDTTGVAVYEIKGLASFATRDSLPVVTGDDTTTVNGLIDVLNQSVLLMAALCSDAAPGAYTLSGIDAADFDLFVNGSTTRASAGFKIIQESQLNRVVQAVNANVLTDALLAAITFR